MQRDPSFAVRPVASLVALVLSVLALPGTRIRPPTARGAMTVRRTADVTAPGIPPTEGHPWAVTGITQAAEHTPLAGVVVRAVLVQDGQSWELARTQSDARGVFTFPSLPEGSYWLVGSAAGRARGLAPLRIHGRASDDSVLTLGEGLPVAGTLTAVDREGPRAFEGAVVQAHREGTEEPGFAARADADGHFTLTGMPPGTYRVDVAEGGYEAVHRVGIAAGSVGLTLAVRALASVEGTVLDSQGAPDRDAVLVLAGSGVWPPRRVPVLADGRFDLPGLPAGVYELRATDGDAVAEPVAPLLLEPGDRRTVTLTVGPGVALAGTVVDADTGRGIPGARVVVVEDALSTAPHALETDARGGYRVAGLLRRSHQVSARATGYAPRTGLVAQPGGAPLTVTLERAAVVEGRLVDGHGAPVANAQVELTVRDVAGTAPPVWLSGSTVAFRDALFATEARGPAPLVPSGELGVMPGRVPIVPLVPVPAGLTVDRVSPGFTTDADGRFHLEEVPSGVMTVAATHPAYVRTESDARLIRSGETVTVALTLHAGGTLDGRVMTERGFPVGGTQVEVRSALDVVPRRAFSARDGTFRVPGVLGHVVLVAYAGARVAARAETDVVDDAVVPVTLTLPGALRRVEGRVVDTRGFPVGAASVTLTSLDRAALGSATTLTEEDGTFDTVVGGTGALSVAVRDPDHAPRTVRVDDTTRVVRIEVEEGSTVTVEVRGDGCVTGEVALELRTPCGPVQTTATESRTVRLEHLCAGHGTLVVNAPGCMQGERPVTVPTSGTVDMGRVDLTAGGGAEGDVVDVRGQPVPGARVAPVEATADSESGTGRSDRHGVFAVANLSAGDVALVATHPALGRSGVVTARIIRGTMARGLRLRFDGDLDRATRAMLEVPVVLTDGRNGPEVRSVGSGSPADRAGLRAGDRVVSVGGVSVQTRAQAERLLPGARGDDVVLEVEREGLRRVVRIQR